MEECCVVFDIVPKAQAGNSTLISLLLNGNADTDIRFTISYPEDKKE